MVRRMMVASALLAGCTVTSCHKVTVDLAKHVGEGEILVVAVGKPGVVDPNLRPDRWPSATRTSTP